MTELSAYLPVIVAVVTALFAAFTYTYQKRVDRKNSLVELRRVAYSGLLEALQKNLMVRNDPSVLVEMNLQRTKAFVVASDEVAKNIGDFFEIAQRLSNSDSPEDGIKIMNAYAEMVIAMRGDCFEETSLTSAEIASASPLSWSGPE